ncbi:hypothetical protein GC167_02015 [bacterium]|nr:hypothetical protein [bacterium]
MWPNLIVGGAPKSGTSSLYFWLDAHPEVCGSPVKEPFFFDDTVSRFNQGCNIHENPIEDYQKHFERCGQAKVVFEASAVYLYSRTALEWIPKLPGGAPKMVFLLREPAARLYSKWKFNRYKLRTTQATWSEFAGIEPGSDPQHFREGFYAEFLSRWFEALGRDRVQVLLFEELIGDPRTVLERLARFLEIDLDFYNKYGFPQHNETYATRNPGLHRKAVGFLPLVPKGLQPSLSALYRRLNATPMPQSDPGERAVLDEVRGRYGPSVDELKALCPNMPWGLWSKRGS